MRDITIGIIGTGMMGQEHIQNFNLLDGAQVTALADTDAAMLAKAAEMTDGTPTLTDDFETLLGDNGPDALVIATPNFHHIDVLDSALEAGKPILCEKPLCTNLDDTQKVMQRVGHNEIIFQVGMEYRFKPALDNMITRVHGGDIGQIQMLSIREHRFPFLPKVADWNRFNRNTGGTLVEKCCHFFDLMRFIIGSEPTGVIASGGQNVNHLDEKYHGQTPIFGTMPMSCLILPMARVLCSIYACLPKARAIAKNLRRLAIRQKSNACCRKTSLPMAIAKHGKWRKRIFMCRTKS